MNKIYAPWRCSYASDAVHGKQECTSPDECIFCDHIKQNNDEKHFILKRTKNVYVVLNLYPYNAGHVMIIPIEHKPKLADLLKEVRSELIEEMNTAIEKIEQELKPHGFNVGMNLGKVAGAGIPSHLHLHIVPRWTGDTNFLPVIGDTKAISFDLVKIYKQLKKAYLL